MPNKIWEDELVDWWIVNNIPVEALDLNNVIAISVLRDVSRPIDKKLKVLWFEVKHNLFWMSYQILQKSIDIMMKQNEDRSLWLDKNVLCVHPEFPWIDYYEFHKYDEIIGIWYVAAKNDDLLSKMISEFK